MAWFRAEAAARQSRDDPDNLLSQISAPAEMTALEAVVWHAYAFADGWNPERLLTYQAFYPMPFDLTLVLELMRLLHRLTNNKDDDDGE